VLSGELKASKEVVCQLLEETIQRVGNDRLRVSGGGQTRDGDGFESGLEEGVEFIRIGILCRLGNGGDSTGLMIELLV